MEVFFYGLFMDETILKKNGIKIFNPRVGCLENYELIIGDRASLVPCKNERSYGIVMSVDDRSIQQLYAEPSVADYLPEEVSIFIDPETTISAICYNLPVEKLSGTNVSYAKSLYRLAYEKGFPDEYLEKIKAMTIS